MTSFGCDIGYNRVKGVVLVNGQLVEISFPSVVGTADVSSFSANINGQPRIISIDGDRFFFGEDAVTLSRLETRREDRDWIRSTTYKVLVRAALTYAVHQNTLNETQAELHLVTGLPVAFYKEDKPTLAREISAISRIEWTEGSATKSYPVRMAKVSVVPQPFGTLFSEAFDADGNVEHPDMLSKPVAVIDMGAKTTNLLVANRGSEIARQSTSVALGGWDIVRAIRQPLLERFSGLDLRDHGLAKAIAKRSVLYFGKEEDISDLVNSTARTFCQSVVAQASQLWGNGAELAAILISGGGARLIGTDLQAHFSQHSNVYTVSDPQMANAHGYYRYSRFLQKQG